MEEIAIELPRRLENNEKAFLFLANLWHSVKNRRNTKIYINLNNCRWIEANLCSPLGLILEKVKSKGNEIYFKDIPQRLRMVLSNNKFLSRLEVINSIKYESTFVAYETFKVKEKEKFETYLLKELSTFINNNNVICDSKAFIRVISEMFINVKMHTNSLEVMTCGYYLPEQKNLYFTISNHGITIAKNIEQKNGYVFHKEINAIFWAVKRSSSTRVSYESGGLGFFTTRNFVNQYNGSLWIISGRGFWKEENRIVSFSEMKSAFPGTSITLRIPLNNTVRKEQTAIKDIFTVDEIIRGEI